MRRCPRRAFDHFDLVTELGTLRLNDPRRFGAVVYVEDEAAPWAIKLLGGLGMEPLGDGFDLDAFHAGLRKRKAAVKQVLLAGDVVVGVGNIYASEALFLAGIRPTLSAARISRPRAARLHAAVREILARAVEKGGSSAARLFQRGRTERLFPARSHGLRTGRRALSGLRNADPAAAPRAAFHLLLPQLSKIVS